MPRRSAERAAGQPPLSFPAYVSNRRRAPHAALVALPAALSDLHTPVYAHFPVREGDNDLTTQHGEPPIGQRIVVAGRLLDEDGRPVPDSLIEIWQANAAGRYRHAHDQHPAPLDPHFTGAGRTTTDGEGRYRFVTIRPGAYPWRNHENAWRPAHIHFSVFGSSFRTRLVTQMYFPDDPLFPYDPIWQSIPDERARRRLIARFDLGLTTPEWALGYGFDLVVRGRDGTPFEPPA